MKYTVLFAVLFVSLVCRSAESPPPSETEIAQALERGKSVRNRQGALPEAFIKTALVLKTGGTRCGHVVVKIEPANGEGGATYKLTEKFKIAYPATLTGVEMEITEYSGTLLLDADLALLSGKQTNERMVAAANQLEKETASATISVKNGELSFERKDKRDNDPELIEQNGGEGPIKLHGVRPIPRNAMVALAPFAAKQPGFKAGISSPFCVPTIDMGWVIGDFMLEPAWLETGVPPKEKLKEGEKEKTNPPTLALRVRLLHGEIDKDGNGAIKVEPPVKQETPTEGIKTAWEDVMVWTFDDNFRVVSLPDNEGTNVETELADPDTLDVDVKLDFDKIRAARDAFEDKKRREMERLTQTPPLAPIPPKTPATPPAPPANQPPANPPVPPATTPPPATPPPATPK